MQYEMKITTPNRKKEPMKTRKKKTEALQRGKKCEQPCEGWFTFVGDWLSDQLVPNNKSNHDASKQKQNNVAI